MLATLTYVYTATCPPSNKGYHLLFVTGSSAAPYQVWTDSPYADVWQTMMAGVGIRVTNVTYDMVLSGDATRVCSSINGSFTNYSACQYAPDLPASATQTVFPVTLKYEIVRTTNNALGTGNVPGGYIIALSSWNIETRETSPTYSQYFGATNFVNSTCTVQQNPIAVQLKTINVAELNPTGGDTNFSINLQCAAAKNVKLTLTDATSPANATNQLTLGPGSTASGVKLRVLYNGAPITFDPNSQATTGTPVGKSTVGAWSIPLTAQYIAAGTPKPGTVKAVATFTLTYQ